MTPLVSIVTGTFQRLAHLRRMIDSVRASVPSTIAVDFVICDGGSTDGTLEYLRQQADVTVIEHGALLGALKAFGDAARAATGDYVVLANDDITFHDGAILAALAYLDAHPMCGAVAFADNRPAPGYGDGYKVQTMPAFNLALNESMSVPYAQVGMFRRWLGDTAGWWGDQHEIMGTGRTYGGDNFLSARIWELGYSIAEVPAARVDDTIPNDSLREINYAAEQANPGVYYKVFGNPPNVPSHPTLPNPQREHLRVLYLPIYEPSYGRYKSGLRDALADVAWTVEWDYLNERGDLTEIVRAWQPHVLLLQQHGVKDYANPYDRSFTEADIAAARAACPGMIVLMWNGDVYQEHLTSAKMLSLLKHFDLMLTVNESVLPTYAANGIRAAYWQVAFEPVDYDHLPHVENYDIVFLANCAPDNEGRRRLGNGLRSMEGLKVGLFGFGWPAMYASGSTTYNFAAGASLYANAKFAIGDNQFTGERGFVSNRIFEALASGAFLLHQRVEGLEELTGLQDGVHYVEWVDFADLQSKIRHYLNPRYVNRRKEIARAGCAFVREHHSFAARVKELFEVLIPMLAETEAVA
jgi:glycosyltransferase involved in cell wall biosynthesis